MKSQKTNNKDTNPAFDNLAISSQLPCRIPLYVAYADKGDIVRPATTVGELPGVKLRKFVLQEAANILGVEKIQYGIPIFKTLKLTRQQAETDGREWLLSSGCDLKLKYFWKPISAPSFKLRVGTLTQSYQIETEDFIDVADLKEAKKKWLEFTDKQDYNRYTLGGDVFYGNTVVAVFSPNGKCYKPSTKSNEYYQCLPSAEQLTI